jgi:hypothetical protein
MSSSRTAAAGAFRAPGASDPMSMPYRILQWLVVAAMLPAAVYARAESANEAELKAAYLLNFAMFVQWPASDRPTFLICQYGSDSLGSGATALTRRSLHGRPISVRKVTGKDLGDCAVLFIPASERARIRDLTQGLRGTHVLTVSDADGAAREGATIGLSVDGQKIVFDVNVAEARRNKLVISAKLLSLAQSITDAP